MGPGQWRQQRGTTNALHIEVLELRHRPALLLVVDVHEPARRTKITSGGRESQREGTVEDRPMLRLQLRRPLQDVGPSRAMGRVHTTHTWKKELSVPLREQVAADGCRRLLIRTQPAAGSCRKIGMRSRAAISPCAEEMLEGRPTSSRRACFPDDVGRPSNSPAHPGRAHCSQMDGCGDNATRSRSCEGESGGCDKGSIGERRTTGIGVCHLADQQDASRSLILHLFYRHLTRQG